ncbi:hypothetical protein [Metabacillus sp. FJAT-53654]|uniref:Uncharacterized protein n=1 Tax=Metabacillus rhizosphaerae TaxID=3117747 RepID=A0ABZ2MNT5_9BACI
MKLSLLIDRDSVHAGDDCESHKKSVTIKEDTPVKVLIEKLIRNKEYVLASIYGGKVLWNVETKGLCIAQVVQTENNDYQVFGVDHLISEYCNEENSVGIKFRYFRYQGKHTFTEIEKRSSVHYPWSPIYYYAGIDYANENQIYFGKWGMEESVI